MSNVTPSPIALITGASAGIGEACAEQLAQSGYRLILCARRIQRLNELADRLAESYGTDCLLIELDVQDKIQVLQRLGELPDEWKKIDVLINNAGLSQGLDPIDKGDLEDWDRMIDTNVKGLLYVSRTIIPWMVERKKGHIVNIGSIAAKEVYPNGNVYCASKHAVDALNKGMRIDLLPYGIKVTGIHPGMVETEFSEVRFHGDKVRAKAVYHQLEPLVAQDIAETITWVLSRPPQVNINDLVIMPTIQASGTQIYRGS
jgi:3-hydroxy acid dehydrogenase/malonic semialdehyde reductase